MPIGLPGPDRVPDGPNRDFLEALHELYGRAGRPAARKISKRIFDRTSLEPVSHETASSMLRGDSVPGWPRVEAVVTILNDMAVQHRELQALLVEFNLLWTHTERQPRKPVKRFGRIGPTASPARVSAAPREQPAEQPHEVDLYIRNTPPSRSPYFTGREPLLAELKRQHTATPEPAVMVYGPIGVGKTQLALRYAADRDEEFAVVWWVDGTTPERALAALAELAMRMGIDSAPGRSQMIADLYVRLQTLSRYLLVFDGADQEIRSLIPTVGGSVVVTTRDASWAAENSYLPVEVPELDHSEAVQFLRKRDPHLDPGLAALFLQRVGRTPLVLEQVSSMFESTARTWEDLADWLTNPDSPALTDAASPLSYPVNAAAVVHAALDRLAFLDPDAAALMPLLAAFGQAPISVQMLLAGAHATSSAELRRVLSDQVRLRKRWPVIVRCGLARLDAQRCINLPPIVRFALQEILPKPVQRQALADVGAIITAADPGNPDNRQTWDQHRAIAPHVLPARLTERTDVAAFATVRNQLRFLFLSGGHAEAQRLGQKADTAWNRAQSLPPVDELMIQSRREWANALRAAGRYAEAERLTAELARRLSEDPSYGADHAIALDVDRSRGHDLRIAGRYGEALELDRATYDRHRAKYGEDDLRTLAARYNVGVSSRFVGRYADGEVNDRADHLRKDFAADDPRAWRTVNALAEDIFGLGRYREVLELLDPLIATTQAAGAPRRSLLRARRTAAAARRRMGDTATAVQELGACYHACVVGLGGDQELSLATAMSYINALRDAGLPETALHHGQRLLHGYERAMGLDNPLVHVARVNISAIRLAVGNRGESPESMTKTHTALAEKLGLRHPFTLAAAVTLASVLAVAGHREQAQQISMRAYAAYRATLGGKHPDTLAAAANFATDRAAIARLDDDAPSLDAVLSELRMELSPQHRLIGRVAGGQRAIVDIEPPSA